MSNIEQAWYTNKKWIWVFLPFTLLFWLISALRRWRYKDHKLASADCSLPVIVVGNITVGGTGKTPFVIFLVELLKKHGYSPAIVSRGYGASKLGPSFPRLVNLISDPSLTGDEPSLLAMRTGCPVVIDANRKVAVKYASQISGVDIIISDDGLQHYKMSRDIEIVLIDGARKFGNGFLLPMGPLRESESRLASVDISVVNSGFIAASDVTSELEYDYRLAATNVIQILTGDKTALSDEHRKVHLVSGIGNPQRFKDTAIKSGLNVISEHWFPDHHNFTKADFDNLKLTSSDDEIVLMTEKDAVKCRKFAQRNWFVLPIDAIISSSLEQVLSDKLRLLTSKTINK